tara:strand:- start:826 stop:1125 length:300 start_codon:yes stop_codon:yes gene_type:complete
MNLYWTSVLPINGLRHFVFVNKILEKGEWKLLLVSVIDIEVNLIVSKDELENSRSWNLGWLELNKSESITQDYFSFKKSKKFSEPTKLFLNDSSPFNLS